MSDIIKASVRSGSGKGVSRELRRNQQIPAVMYGTKKGEPIALAISEYDLMMSMQKGGFFTHRHTLEIDGKKTEALARDIQRHPVSEKVIHVDFMEYDPARKMRVNVGVRVIDEDQSPGLKKGGVLQLVRAEVELICRADSIPSELVASMAGKDIGEAVHMSEIELPEGVQPKIHDRDFTVASVVGTRTSTMADLEEDGESTEAEEEASEGEEKESE
ncbi:MAG: 50S ribosomal protein L25/general stress protein Ctc [Alphaproteobacteria bacterium]|nr:50S ribosomal protein L25/general stress protein Ctc [Alphaproteobacteria bacterium]